MEEGWENGTEITGITDESLFLKEEKSHHESLVFSLNFRGKKFNCFPRHFTLFFSHFKKLKNQKAINNNNNKPISSSSSISSSYIYMRAMRRAQKHQKYDESSAVANNIVASLIWLATFGLIPNVFQAYGKDETVRLGWTFSLSHIVIDILQGIVPLPFLLLIEGAFVGVFFATVSDPEETEAIKIVHEDQAQENIWTLAFSSSYCSVFIFIIEVIQIHKLIFTISNKVLSTVFPSDSDDNYNFGELDDDSGVNWPKAGASLIVGVCVAMYGVAGYFLWSAFLGNKETYLGVILSLLCICGIGLSMWVSSGTFIGGILTLLVVSLNVLYGSNAASRGAARALGEKAGGNKWLTSQGRLTNLEWSEIFEAAVALFVFGVGHFQRHKNCTGNTYESSIHRGKGRRRRRRGSDEEDEGFLRDCDGNGIGKECKQVREIVAQCVMKVIVIGSYTGTVINIRRYGNFGGMWIDLFHTRLIQSFVLVVLLFYRLFSTFYSDYYD